MKKYSKVFYLLILSFLVLSCNVDAGSDNSGELAAIKDNQKRILKKLETIEKNQAGIRTSVASISKPSKQKDSKKQQPQADPNKVYDIAIGDSYVEGNPNAPITIIEWSDFQ